MSLSDSSTRVPGRQGAQSGLPKSRKKGSSLGNSRPPTAKLKKARGKTTSQQRWLNRQINDPYVAAAHEQGWRSRAAFKLLEINQKYHLLKPGLAVVDLGAAPGGWSQVAVQEGCTSVIALDLLAIEPLEKVTAVQGDFLADDMPGKLEALLNGRADVVISDLAPNTTGHAGTDHLRIMALAENALAFAEKILAPNGAFIAKVFQGGSTHELLSQLKRNFTSVRHVKPPASRKESRELYVVATGFRKA